MTTCSTLLSAALLKYPDALCLLLSILNAYFVSLDHRPCLLRDALYACVPVVVGGSLDLETRVGSVSIDENIDVQLALPTLF